MTTKGASKTCANNLTGLRKKPKATSIEPVSFTKLEGHLNDTLKSSQPVQSGQ